MNHSVIYAIDIDEHFYKYTVLKWFLSLSCSSFNLTPFSFVSFYIYIYVILFGIPEPTPTRDISQCLWFFSVSWNVCALFSESDFFVSLFRSLFCVVNVSWKIGRHNSRSAFKNLHIMRFIILFSNWMKKKHCIESLNTIKINEKWWTLPWHSIILLQFYAWI